MIAFRPLTINARRRLPLTLPLCRSLPLPASGEGVGVGVRGAAPATFETVAA